MAINVYQMVTDHIIEELKSGIIPWRKPWVGGTEKAINYVSREPYKGINTLLLPEPGEYLTFKQVQALKGKVKKGAKGHMVVFFSPIYKDEVENATGITRKVLQYCLLRYYKVFHIKDTEGIESKAVAVTARTTTPIQEAEATIEDYLDREPFLKFQNDAPSDRAFYSPAEDKVVVPMINQYTEASEYYSTIFHEFVHSTAKEHRCNRELDGGAFYGGETYSKEELVAEIGSAMLCNRTGIEVPATFKNSVSYIANWIKALNDDNKMIVWAAGRAEMAARYILNDVVETPANA